MPKRKPQFGKNYVKAQQRIAACWAERSRALDLSRLDLTALPPEIEQLTAITRLDLRGNHLSVLPPAITQLAALAELDVAENQLTTLPPTIGNLGALTVLDLDGNQLTALPAEIGKLTKLTALALELNQLTTLPPEIGQLRTLIKLYLAGNQLTLLPAELGQLTALTTLHVQQNQLAALPAEIGQLTTLTNLYLQENKLIRLPSQIRQLTALQRLYLHDNAALGLPSELLGPTWLEVAFRNATPKPPAEIFAAYFRIAAGRGEPLGECKLIVVGRGGAGKTSLIKRLHGLSYDPNEPETHGITIQNLAFPTPLGDVTARIWDFGGQVVLHSMHEFFLTARSLYLLVLGERDDMFERDAAYWLQLIRSYADDAPVVVALNKSAGRERPFDPQSLRQQYGPILDFVSTECSVEDPDRGGITRLREALTAALDSPLMDSVRRKFPKKWHSIKNELEQMSDTYLEYAEYIRRCEKHGETDPSEQVALAGDLHDLGVALNYTRDARLRETSVLRPDWLANGIYAVLRANDREENLPSKFNRELAQGGVVDADSLDLIHRKAEAWNMLRAADYPPEKRDFLLRLMELFHLSYPLDDEGRQQLVPSLLPLTPPAGSDEPAGSERVRLRYEFQVVPAPLIPWFIARAFSLIPNRLHWRRGAILEYGAARARVWTTEDERYVFATIAGPQQSRERLLAMIRGTLHRIFSEYKALLPVEQWEHKGCWVPREALEEFGVLPRRPRRGGRDADARLWDEEA